MASPAGDTSVLVVGPGGDTATEATALHVKPGAHARSLLHELALAGQPELLVIEFTKASSSYSFRHMRRSEILVEARRYGAEISALLAATSSEAAALPVDDAPSPLLRSPHYAALQTAAAAARRRRPGDRSREPARRDSDDSGRLLHRQASPGGGSVPAPHAAGGSGHHGRTGAVTSYLQSRDLRVIDPSFEISRAPAVLVRRHAIVVNLPPIRMVILPDKAWLLPEEGADEDLAPIIERLTRQSAAADQAATDKAAVAATAAPAPAVPATTTTTSATPAPSSPASATKSLRTRRLLRHLNLAHNAPAGVDNAALPTSLLPPTAPLTARAAAAWTPGGGTSPFPSPRGVQLSALPLLRRPGAAPSPPPDATAAPVYGRGDVDDALSAASSAAAADRSARDVYRLQFTDAAGGSDVVLTDTGAVVADADDSTPRSEGGGGPELPLLRRRLAATPTAAQPALSTPGDGESPAPTAHEFTATAAAADELPFEFVVLETALLGVVAHLKRAHNGLAPLVLRTIALLTRQAGSEARLFDALRRAKRALADFIARVKAVHRVLGEVLDTPEDLRSMALTALLEIECAAAVEASAVAVGCDADDSDDDAPAPTPLCAAPDMPTLSVRVPPPSGDTAAATAKRVATNAVPLDDVEDAAEVLLEAYLAEVELVLGRAKGLRDELDAAADQVDLVLATGRNRLLRAEVGLTSLTLTLTASTVVSGFFGMNLRSGLENSGAAFTAVVGGCAAGCAALLVVLALYLKTALK